jgi:predicted permease
MQVSLATALLMVSGLSVRTAMALRDFDYGFDTKDLLTARIDLAPSRYGTADEMRRRVDGLVEALAAQGQTSGVAVGTELPVLDRVRQMTLVVEGREVERSRIAVVTSATPGYFRMLGIPVTRGREFAETDRPESQPVAVVNETLAAREFGGSDPRGRRIQVGGPGTPWLEIVGVAKDIANPSLGQPPMAQAYVPYAQRPERSFVLMIRTAAGAPVLTFLREALRAADPDQPLYDAKTAEQAAWEDLASNRIITGLFMALGIVSLSLSAVGLYGLTAFLVAQRSREIGVRMALGASVRDILAMVISQGARLTAAGLLMGLLLGLGLGRAMSSVLFSVKPWDPLTMVGTLGALAFAATLAHWGPARRAASVNPVEALRQD